MLALEKFHAAFRGFEELRILKFHPSGVLNPGHARRGIGLAPTAVVYRLAGSKIIRGVIEVRLAVRVGQVEARLPPTPGGLAHDRGQLRLVGIAVGESVEHEVGEHFIPEGAAGAALLMVEHQVQAVLAVEPRLAHGNIVVFLPAFVDADQSRAQHRAQAGDALLAVDATLPLIGIANVAGQPERRAVKVDPGVVQPHQRQELSL